MTLKNSVDIVHFADTYNALQLKKTVIEFMCVNLAAFLEGSYLLDLKDDLAEELSTAYQAMVRRNALVSSHSFVRTQIPAVGARELKMTGGSVLLYIYIEREH